MNLRAKARLILSGKLSRNRWENLSGAVAFIKGHPVVDDKIFRKLFAHPTKTGVNPDLDAKGMHLLQRFMMAFTIARLSSVLKLKDCSRQSITFSPHPDEAAQVATYTAQPKAASAAARRKGQKDLLKFAVKAQMRSLHPMWDTEDPSEEEYDPESLESIINGTLDVARDAWLASVRHRTKSDRGCNEVTVFLGALRVFDEQLRTRTSNCRLFSVPSLSRHLR